jgi:YgiT-type zinc finger domain-containing protein
MKSKKCPVCDQEMVPVEDIVSEVEGQIFIEKGLRCQSCGEEFISEAEGQKMIKIARKMNVWGEPLKLHRKMSRSSRGAVIRIPTDIEKALGLKGDEDIKISKIGKKKILIEIE